MKHRGGHDLPQYYFCPAWLPRRPQVRRGGRYSEVKGCRDTWGRHS